LIDQLPWDLLAFFQSTISFMSSNKRRVLCQRKNTSLKRDFHFYLKTPTNHGSAKAAINWFVSLLQDVVSFSLCYRWLAMIMSSFVCHLSSEGSFVV
jgi:hypothetical protein